MPSECMAIGREPRSEKTEGFRACPASKEAERIRLRKKQREFGFERSGESRGLKTEGFQACPASKEVERIRIRRKRREFGFERRKILYEQQLVETFKNNKSS